MYFSRTRAFATAARALAPRADSHAARRVDMNGIELAERVRHDHPDMPVLLCTGYIDELPAQPSTSGYAVLTKPYREAELAERLRQALDGTSAGQAAASFGHQG